MDTNNISDELQQVLHGVGHQYSNKTIKSRSVLRYSYRVIAPVNKEEENTEGKKRKMKKGTMNVSGLFHKRSKKSDPGLAWEMFHKIYHMYSNIKNKEETNEALMLTSMSDQKDTNKVSETTVKLNDNSSEPI